MDRHSKWFDVLIVFVLFITKSQTQITPNLTQAEYDALIQDIFQVPQNVTDYRNPVPEQIGTPSQTNQLSYTTSPPYYHVENSSPLPNANEEPNVCKSIYY